MAEPKPIDGTDFYLWKYLPSLPLAATAILLFTLVTSAHCWRMVKTRTWFCSPFAAGGFFQIIGYTTRLISRAHTNQIAPYAIQSCFILLAPVFYAASIYMVLSRVIRSVRGERFSLVPTKWMTWIFVGGDVLALNVQGNGAGLAVKEKLRGVGEGLVIAGLVVQLVVFGLYVVVAVVFDRRMRREGAKEVEAGEGVPWKMGLRMLYACSALITVRSVFRLVEYVMGTDSYLFTVEWPAYVFDGVLMFGAQVVFVCCYPDRFPSLAAERVEDEHELVENVSVQELGGRSALKTV